MTSKIELFETLALSYKGIPETTSEVYPEDIEIDNQSEDFAIFAGSYGELMLSPCRNVFIGMLNITSPACLAANTLTLRAKVLFIGVDQKQSMRYLSTTKKISEKLSPAPLPVRLCVRSMIDIQAERIYIGTNVLFYGYTPTDGSIRCERLTFVGPPEEEYYEIPGNDDAPTRCLPDRIRPRYRKPTVNGEHLLIASWVEKATKVETISNETFLTRVSNKDI